MNKQVHRLEREKLLLRYTTALDAGDLDTVARVLQMAELDAELERMILEANEVMASELEHASHAQDDEAVAALIHDQLRSALAEVTPEPPPLTVGHVMARIHADAALAGRVEREMLAATRRFQNVETPLPTDLSLRAVGKLLEQLGLKVGRRFQDIFRETAIYMRMGRNQGMARLAAYRQQASALPSAPLLYMRAMPTPDEGAAIPPPPRTLHEPPSEEAYTAAEQAGDKPDNQDTEPSPDSSTGPSTGRADKETE